MSFKLHKTEINQFRTTGIIKLSNFFDKREIAYEDIMVDQDQS